MLFFSTNFISKKEIKRKESVGTLILWKNSRGKKKKKRVIQYTLQFTDRHTAYAHVWMQVLTSIKSTEVWQIKSKSDCQNNQKIIVLLQWDRESKAPKECLCTMSLDCYKYAPSFLEEQKLNFFFFPCATCHYFT